MYPTITQSESVALIRHLKLVFDLVRLVDVSNMIQYNLNENDELIPGKYKCYAVWNKEDRCENCISAKAFASKNRLTKYEFVGDDIYYVVAKYMIIGDKEYIIEIVSKVTDEILFGAFGKDTLINTLLQYNDKIYKDPLTGAYNRYYYEEQLQALKNTPAVAMLDIDRFKQINDTFGHPAGDAVLREVVKVIRKNVRSGDVVIRYGGDEFLIVFNSMDKSSYARKLEELKQLITSITIDEYPDLKFTVSIGGCFFNEPGMNAIRAADKMLYCAKRIRNTVCFCENSKDCESCSDACSKYCADRSAK